MTSGFNDVYRFGLSLCTIQSGSKYGSDDTVNILQEFCTHWPVTSLKLEVTTYLHKVVSGYVV